MLGSQRLRVVATSVLLLSASALLAQTGPKVALVAKDGSTTIRGELVGIEGGFFVVRSHMGVVGVPIDKVFCEGECPEGTTAADAAPATEAAPAVAAAEPAAEAPAAEAPAPVEVAAPVEEPASVQVAEVPADKKFGIHGSRTLGTHLMPNLLQAYATKVGATFEQIPVEQGISVIRLTAADGTLLAEIDLQLKGSGSAFPGLGEGLAQIGMADRRMKDDDLEKLGTLGELRDTPNEIVLGLDGIVAMVHPSNPLQALSFEELSRVFSGEVTNWRDLGGPDLPINLKTFPDGSGDRSIFTGRALEPFGRSMATNATEFVEYADMREAVANDPTAIGFLGRSFIRDNVKELSIREQCGLVSSPSNFRMKTEGYAMSRRIYLYRTPGELNPVAQDLLDFAQSPEGQQIIEDTRFVDSEIEKLRLSDMAADIEFARSQPDFQPAAMEDMMSELGSADRLSIAFRFAFGKASLDPLSERSVETFAAQLESGAFDGKEVLVVGFADSVGSFEQNNRLALARARSVANLIETEISEGAAGRLGLKALSYGELLPFLCNDDDFGREANRRVEIWVR